MIQGPGRVLIVIIIAYIPTIHGAWHLGRSHGWSVRHWMTWDETSKTDYPKESWSSYVETCTAYGMEGTLKCVRNWGRSSDTLTVKFVSKTHSLLVVRVLVFRFKIDRVGARVATWLVREQSITTICDTASKRLHSWLRSDFTFDNSGEPAALESEYHTSDTTTQEALCLRHRRKSCSDKFCKICWLILCSLTTCCTLTESWTI